MLIEHFMIGLPQVDHAMRRAFREVLGEAGRPAFWDAYMDAYLAEDDFAYLRSLGFNHVRLAFDYRHLESDWHPRAYRPEGFALLDRVIEWCRRHDLYVLLDLHAAPGCQAADWNAGSADGEALLLGRRRTSRIAPRRCGARSPGATAASRPSWATRS